LKGGIGLKPGAPNSFAFSANDTTSFDHPGALHPSVLTVFICNSLRQRCGANDAAQERCAEGIVAAHNLGNSGDQAAVDAFNKNLGF
jgi:hypothetical protein